MKNQDFKNEPTLEELQEEISEALNSLDSIKEWIDNTPEVLEFINKEPPRAKGMDKMKQLLEDLRRDTKFVSKLTEISDTKPTYASDDIRTLYALHVAYKLALKKFKEDKLFSDKQYGLKKSLCKKYGIDPFLLDCLLHYRDIEHIEDWDFAEEATGDVCKIIDNDKDEPGDIHSFHVDTLEDLDNVVFPVTLSIHKYASKRDVLDFIEKNWTEEINPYLEKKIIKSRKLPRKVVDYIWSLRALKSSEIADSLRDKYPDHSLAYPDINQVLSEEKKRRNVE